VSRAGICCSDLLTTTISSVQGGSAGAVVANRLTENPKVNVLLLEAGPDENEVTDVPSLAAYLQLSNLDWSYKTEPLNTACLGMVNNRCNWPRGKVSAQRFASLITVQLIAA
jgi:choline dehydrogenase-like flavoprotein